MENKNKKLLKWLKFLVIVCVAIIVVEGLYIGVKIYQSKNNTVYVDTLGSIVELKDGYLGTGSSDFKKSKYNEYSKDYQKAKLVKYDKNQKIVFESAYTKGYDSYFYDAKATKNGYIAVGTAAYSKKQVEEKTKDGLIVLYDKDGKQLKTKTLQIAGNTKFTKVEVLDDGYLVIGQSILENMTIGTDPDGGAIMVKYDFDLKEQWRTNYGGSKSAIFNDLSITDDAIYLVGKDATRYGFFAKFSKLGEKEFVKTYEYTDVVGFSSIAKLGDDFVVVGGKTTNIDAADKDKKTEAVLIRYDKDGNIKYEKYYRVNKSARYNKVLVDGSNIVAIGHTAKKDEKESTDSYNVFRYSGLFAKYKEDGEEITKKNEKGSRDIYFSDMLVTKNGYLVVGQTSSKELGGNNKDLISYFLKYDKNGKIVK